MAFDSRPPITPISGLPDLSLRLHEWFLTHRSQLVKWWVIAILALDAAIIGFVLVSLLSFYIQNPKYERLAVGLAQSLEPAPALREQAKTAPDVVWAGAVKNQDATDFVALVRNDNETWTARLKYHFVAGASVSESRTATLPPNQSAYVFALGQPVNADNNAKPDLVIDQADWTRVIDRNLIDNTAFRVENVVVEPSAVAPNSGASFARVSADVVNDSLYGFWVVDVPVVLLQGETPVAVRSVTLRAVRAGEKRAISAEWFTQLPSTTAADIRPVVDLTDEQNFMAP